jgi:cytochrome oxidase Cu insertion factor (SCO1/SenC/PrrC family)
VEPVLLEELSRNCQRAETVGNDFKDVGLSIGQRAVNFTLKDTQGAEFRLSQLLVERPVVMVFGSFT